MKINLFIKEWNKLYTSLLDEYSSNQRLLNNLQKTTKTVNYIKNIFNIVNNKAISIRSAIKQLKLLKYKSRIYSFINKIKQVTKSKIKSLIIKNTGPIRIKYKYDQQTRKKMCDDYYINLNNKVNVWLKFRHFFPNLSLRIVCKIINEDGRNTKNKTRAKLKHDIRDYNLDFGCLQMDLKIIGPKESPTGKRITIYDAKDEQSKLYYMEIVEDSSTDNLLQATKNMLAYFKGLNLTVKRIRTDNAMMFKQNNFVKSFPYDNLLKENNIINEKIPVGQPECNGCIERHHLILDKEFFPLIKSDDDILSLNQKAKDFTKKFNYERYHFYTFLTYDKKYPKLEQKYFKPIEFFNMFK